MNKENKKIIVGASTVIIIIFLYSTFSDKTVENPDWQEEYALQIKLNELQEYTEPDSKLTVTNEEYSKLLTDVKANARNAEDAVQKIIDWTYYNIEYQPDTNIFCPSETPDDIIGFGTGNCVSMTKINLALLSGLGFAVRPTGGCVSRQNSCRPLFAVEPDRVRKWVPITEGDNQLRGGLHLWLEVWFPEQGWMIVESTAGTIYSKTCQDYDVDVQSYDSYVMCYQTNPSYIAQCANF